MLKSICIPGVPPVDVSRLWPVIDSQPFQALRDRKQLGINYLVFPGAVHTRFEHSIGVLSLTQRLCAINKIPPEEANHLQAFALLHDIGHGPFSHQVESVLPGDHHRNGTRIIASMGRELAAAGVSTERIIDMMEGRDSLGQWVSDRNLGADKLDYLSRDALHIGFHGTPDIERLQYSTLLTDEGMAIEEKFVEDAKQLQKFYSYLHQHGYLNKTTLSAQRMLQRACQERLPSVRENVWTMNDWQLFALLQDGTSPLSSELASRLARRQLHRSFLVLKPQGYGYVEREADKAVAVFERSRSDLRLFCDRFNDIAELANLEDAIAARCGLAPGEILFAAMPYFRKLIPKDLRVFSSGGHSSYWLFEKDTDHRKSLESDYLRTFAVRLVCKAEYRSQLCGKAEELLAFIGI